MKAVIEITSTKTTKGQPASVETILMGFPTKWQAVKFAEENELDVCESYYCGYLISGKTTLWKGARACAQREATLRISARSADR